VSLNEGIRKGDFAYWKYQFRFRSIFPIGARQAHGDCFFEAWPRRYQEKGGSHVPFFDMPMIEAGTPVRGLDVFAS